MQNYTFLPKDASIFGKMFESEEDKKKPQIRNPTKVSERCGPNRQECDFSSSD